MRSNVSSSDGGIAVRGVLNYPLREPWRAPNVDVMFAVRSSPPRTRRSHVTESSGTVSGVFADRYTIERELGRGATSVVYLARQHSDGRAVAIKILREELVTEISTERFLREIRVTTRLQHPNIVPVLDSGQVDGRPFFVLPHMDGGTLRARLEREKQLPIPDVLSIGKAIAAALQFAHEHSLLHRDVKPENILFADGEARLADFGIARALSESTSSGAAPSTTSTGVVRGTPAYMSPEQAAGDHQIDARSDIYSLACVLYEAVAGVPAFVGPTPQSVISQRLSHMPRGVRVYRPTASIALERTLGRALALAPVDRYQTAREFGTDLGNAGDATSMSQGARSLNDAIDSRSTGRRRLAWSAAGVGAIAISMATLATYGPIRVDGFTRGTLDSLTYAVVPIDGGSSVSVGIGGLIRESLGHLTGIAVTQADRSRSAGRQIRLDVAPVGDSLRLHATLVDQATKTAISEATVRLSRTLANSDSIMTTLVDRLLFPEATNLDSRDAGGGTSSVPARHSYLRGRAALIRWDLTKSDSEFRHAMEVDPKYSAAALHLAQVRQWTGQPISQWGYAAELAQAGKSNLSLDDQLLTDALVQLARGHRDSACSTLSDLTKRDETSFATWYSLGNCLRFDSVVVRDHASPSKWKFRSSYQQAINAYDRAFAVLPATHRMIGVGLIDGIGQLLNLSGPRLRAGHAVPPDTTRFRAWPTWDGDSLAFVPFPVAQFDVADRGMSHSAAVDNAILEERHHFVQIARGWRSQLSQSAEAAEAVARSLDLLGNASAFDTLRLARRLSQDGVDRLRLGALEVLMRVKYSAPSDLDQLNAARALADSLLVGYTPADPTGMKLFASLAVLTGRINLAARYSRSKEASALAPALDRSAPSLLTFSAAGGPVDSLKNSEAAVWRAITTSVLPSDRESAISQWLARPAFLAIPNYRFATSKQFRQNRRFENLVAAWEQNDLAQAQRVVGDLRDQRRRGGVRARDVTIDAVYGEAAVLASLSDTRGAIAWLDPVIDSISFVSPEQLADVARAGPLVRSMALRADLAHAIGDSAAASKWARAVVILWSSADDFLMPVVARMRTYAK
jgi:tRNA A-37 threonylcarbamoyl transferase component Bud32/tetratricopeptide (TPR) repeat protein